MFHRVFSPNANVENSEVANIVIFPDFSNVENQLFYLFLLTKSVCLLQKKLSAKIRNVIFLKWKILVFFCFMSGYTSF